MKLKQLKLLALEAASRFGVGSFLLSTNWRRSHLLILGYHGVSIDDEHRWEPGLYISAEQLRARLERLHDLNCTILPLGEGVERLYAGTLPDRSVVITFDDGFYDFYKIAWPMLKEFSCPATVYLTTYYSEYNRPVFDPMCGYMLWKSHKRELLWPEILPEPVMLDERGRRAVEAAVKAYCLRMKLSGAGKEIKLSELGEHLEIDADGLRRKRILHLMTREEVREIASEGADIQLHTHRHRVSCRRERFWREIDENRDWIRVATGCNATHFCYPSGFWLPEFAEWLRARGVVSATTCDLGLASPASDPFALPRLLDSSTLTGTEFSAWVTGTARFVPKRRQSFSDFPSLEKDDEKTARAAAAGKQSL